MMKRALVVCLILTVLASCVPAETPQNIPTATTTPYPSTETPTPLPPSPTLPPKTPSATVTPEICDPFTEDYCITDGHFLFRRPILPPANTSVDKTYRFASTANGTRDPHRGVEFLNKFGTPVYAAGEGTVLFAGPDEVPVYSPWRNFYGNLVVIEHADDLYTLYAHLAEVTVQPGQRVVGGEQIGAVGQTGVAIGSHLHFEVRHGNVEDYFSPKNPELWLVPNQDESGRPMGVLQLSIMVSTGQLVSRASYTLEHFPGTSQPSDAIYYEGTYSPELLNGEENAGISDLPSGTYRLALTYNGHIHERWVEVESGRLTQVVIVVN